MILGTAGHVDHGKTALVRALTGVDTDRLAEEKRRGITIELGFAPLKLNADLVLGVVDVPGHEAFVRTMLAGATGIDLALLAIAADEGVMPQTREHLEILRLLGTAAGVVALTKVDLVDAEWLALVEEEVSAALAGTPLEDAVIVHTSAITGEGLALLRREIAAVAYALPQRSEEDVFRLPVDRVFTVHGTGTVVTGTVWSGTIKRDAQVTILPAGLRARVRGIETHGQAVLEVGAGGRAAIALAGVDVTDAQRGTVLVTDPAWRPSTVLTGEVMLLPGAPDMVGPRRRLHFHLGTVDSEARIVAAGGAVAPGDRRQVRVILAQPVVARAGDRFVLRGGSPMATIGGGVVNDPFPGHRRARPWPRGAADSGERLSVLLGLQGEAGLATRELPVRIGASPSDVGRLVGDAAGPGVLVGDRLYPADLLREMKVRLLDLVDAFHAEAPLEAGAPLQLLRSRLGAADTLAAMVIGPLVAEGQLSAGGAAVWRTGWSPRPTREQQQRLDRLKGALREAGSEPPSVSELAATYGEETDQLLRYLERQGTVVRVETERYYDRSNLGRMMESLRDAMQGGEPVGPAALREALGVSRKFLIPFLEYCDRSGVTERRADGRVLRKLPAVQLDT